MVFSGRRHNDKPKRSRLVFPPFILVFILRSINNSRISAVFRLELLPFQLFVFDNLSVSHSRSIVSFLSAGTRVNAHRGSAVYGSQAGVHVQDGSNPMRYKPSRVRRGLNHDRFHRCATPVVKTLLFTSFVAAYLILVLGCKLPYTQTHVM